MKTLLCYSRSSLSARQRRSRLVGFACILLLSTNAFPQNPLDFLKPQQGQRQRSPSPNSGTSGAINVDINPLDLLKPKPKQPQQLPSNSSEAIAVMKQRPERDRVLWLYVVGLMQMREGKFHDARLSFEEALQIVDGRFGKDRTAERARGYFTKEAKKTFVGEPYERVMANYYLGILYWMEEGHNRARPCFRNALYEDSYVGDEHFASDYVLCEYLEALAATKSGQDMSEPLARARAITNTVTMASSTPSLPDPLARANVLVFVEFGNGPVKVADGNHQEVLKIQPVASPTKAARLRIGDRTWDILPNDDVFFQAATRGGRVMDHVNKGKAVFKESADQTSDILLAGAVVATAAKADERVALGLAAAGLLGKLVSGAATAEADTRCWYNLPQFLGFVAVELAPGNYRGTIEFLPSVGSSYPSLEGPISVTVSEDQRDTVLFFSEKGHFDNQAVGSKSK